MSKYFFIVGCPRSGTTLLSVLLDRHPRLCVTPETAFYDDVAPQLQREGPGGLARVLKEWPRLAELRLTPEMVLRRLESRAWKPSDVLATILDLYAIGQNKSRCGEKTPQHLLHGRTILEDFFGAKILCIQRDGREVALSLNSMPWFGSQGLVAAARAWKQSVQTARELTSQCRGRFLMVLYEELASQPQPTLAAVMEFLGEDFDPRHLDANVPSRVVLDRSLAWKGAALQPVTGEGVSRRLQRAAPEELQVLEREIGEDLRQLGYL